MNNELNLQGLAVSLQDFEASGWKEVVTQASSEGYLKMWLDLSGASRSAIEQGRLEHGKVLWLLADVCSMMLSPSSTNEPFRPYAVFPNRRSVGPDDFLVSNITFFAEIVDAVDVPVIAAGGIADSRGVVAAFALGASAVQIGSRFVVANECIAHENYKQAVLKAKDRSTVVTGVATGHPVRVIANKLSREYLEKEKSGVSAEELEELGAGTLQLAARKGDTEKGSVMIGQISGMINACQSVEEIIQEIIQGIPAVMNNLKDSLE